MEIKGTKDINKSQYKFRIPISSLNVNVSVYNIVGSVISRGFPSMRNIHKCSDDSRTPVSKPSWCDTCNRTVDESELVKGYEVGKNEYVYVTKEEVDDIKAEFASENMKIIGFTKLETPIRPRDVMGTYVLLPPEAKLKKETKDAELNKKYYALLADKLLKDDVYIVGKVFTVKGENFVVITGSNEPNGPMLVMYALYYQDELRTTERCGYKTPALEPKELELMSKLVDKGITTPDYAMVGSELKEVFNDLVKSRNVDEIPKENGAKAVIPEDKAIEDTVSELERALDSA